MPTEKIVWSSVSKKRAHVMSHRATSSFRRQRERETMGKSLDSGFHGRTGEAE